MSKKIGIDIDCTMTDLDIVLKKMSEHYEVDSVEVEDVKDYNISSVYGITEEEAELFWKNHEGWICENSVLNKKRFEKIKEMFVEEGDSVFIMTSRANEFADVTAQWLEDNEIEHDVLLLTDGRSKLPIIKHFNLDIMIDDKPELFSEVKSDESLNTKMVCVDYAYNKEVDCDIRIDREGNVL